MDILDDLSRLALANVMWGAGGEGCPSYFVHLYSDAFSRFVQRGTPLLAKLLHAPAGTAIPFGIPTEIEVRTRREEKPRVRRRPRFELDLHSGHAECLGRTCVADDQAKQWWLSVFRVRGDKHLAFDY